MHVEPDGLAALAVGLAFFFFSMREIAGGVFEMLAKISLWLVLCALSVRYWPVEVAVAAFLAWRFFSRDAPARQAKKQWKPRLYAAGEHPTYMLDRERFFDRHAILYGDGNPLPAGEYRGFSLQEHNYPSGTGQRWVTAYSFTKADGTNELGAWPDVTAAIDAIVDETDWEKR